jgi:hypothetical protein
MPGGDHFLRWVSLSKRSLGGKLPALRFAPDEPWVKRPDVIFGLQRADPV